LKNAKDSGIEINARCDFLNRQLLSNIKKDGCKLLHLSSEVFEEERLCLEGTDGIAEYMTLDELTQALIPDKKDGSHLNPSNQQVKVELVVLAMPVSNKLA
jgi:hypothetical protein